MVYASPEAEVKKTNISSKKQKTDTAVADNTAADTKKKLEEEKKQAEEVKKQKEEQVKKERISNIPTM